MYIYYIYMYTDRPYMSIQYMRNFIGIKNRIYG